MKPSSIITERPKLGFAVGGLINTAYLIDRCDRQRRDYQDGLVNATGLLWRVSEPATPSRRMHRQSGIGDAVTRS